MSEIQVGQINSTDGSTAITTGADGYVSFAKTQIGGRRNLIINGAMQVAQRGDTSGITSTSYGGPDRFVLTVGSHGTWTVSQSSTAPTGFANSYKLDCTATGTGGVVAINHKMEGQNLQHLKKGTADAESITLSFWVRCNKTGVMQVNFIDNDNDRMISSSVTIGAADTWEYKTITVVGDTSGSLGNDNGHSMNVEFMIDSSSAYTSGTAPTSWTSKANADRNVLGTLSLADSTSNEILLTGVQLEVGTIASPFEHRSYGEELALCQRYFEKSYSQGTNPGTATRSGMVIGCALQGTGTTSNLSCFYGFAVLKRATPTIVFYDSAGTSAKCDRHAPGVNEYTNSAATNYQSNDSKIGMVSGSGSSASGVQFHFTAEAEL